MGVRKAARFAQGCRISLWLALCAMLARQKRENSCFGESGSRNPHAKKNFKKTACLWRDFF
jgi:hypothetical protein